MRIKTSHDENDVRVVVTVSKSAILDLAAFHGGEAIEQLAAQLAGKDVMEALKRAFADAVEEDAKQRAAERERLRQGIHTALKGALSEMSGPGTIQVSVQSGAVDAKVLDRN